MLSHIDIDPLQEIVLCGAVQAGSGAASGVGVIVA